MSVCVYVLFCSACTKNRNIEHNLKSIFWILHCSIYCVICLPLTVIQSPVKSKLPLTFTDLSVPQDYTVTPVKSQEQGYQSLATLITLLAATIDGMV